MTRRTLKLTSSWKLISSISQLRSARLPCLKSICLPRWICKSTLGGPVVTCGYMQRVEDVSHPMRTCSWAELGGTPPSCSSSQAVNRLPFGDLVRARLVVGFVNLLMPLFKKSPKTSAETGCAPKTQEALLRLAEKTHLLDSFTQTNHGAVNSLGAKQVNKSLKTDTQRRSRPQGHGLTGTSLYFPWNKCSTSTNSGWLCRKPTIFHLRTILGKED